MLATLYNESVSLVSSQSQARITDLNQSDCRALCLNAPWHSILSPSKHFTTDLILNEIKLIWPGATFVALAVNIFVQCFDNIVAMASWRISMLITISDWLSEFDMKARGNTIINVSNIFIFSHFIQDFICHHTLTALSDIFTGIHLITRVCDEMILIILSREDCHAIITLHHTSQVWWHASGRTQLTSQSLKDCLDWIKGQFSRLLTEIKPWTKSEMKLSR